MKMNYIYSNKMTSTPIFHLYNEHHTGDNIFGCIMFHNIKDYLIANNITIHYYINTNWFNQLDQIREYIPCDNIKVFDINEKPTDALNIWIGSMLNGRCFFNTCELNAGYNMPFDDFLRLYYNLVIQKMNIPIQMTKFQYTDQELLSRYDRLPESCKAIDILVINSLPYSGQYSFDEKQWANRINELDDQFNIITTRKVDGIKCTLDHQLSLKNIAALSTRCKVIIGVNTGVVPGLFNSYTLANVKKIFLMDNSITYNGGHLKIQNVQDITAVSISELNEFMHS